VIKWLSLVVAIAGLSSGWPFASLEAQTVVREREATITGPRGRSIDRRLEVERGPGGYERRLQIQRPGATLERDFRIQPGPRGSFAAGGWGPRPMVVERNIFVGPRPGPSWSFGFMAAPILTFPFWQSPPPPPVVVAPPPVVAAPPGNGAAAAPGTAAQPSPLDPVALEAQRLQSHHASSRRDAAVALGRLGDPRAVPALVHVLKYDSSKDVKIASATALGQLGGSEAEVVLERCIIYEKKQEVRDAAATALQHLRENSVVVRGPSRGSSSPVTQTGPGQGGTTSTVPRLSAPLPAAGTLSSPFRARPPAEEPALDGPSADGSPSSGAERVPPPPPTPVEPR
jgi:hypothetical protein